MFLEDWQARCGYSHTDCALTVGSKPCTYPLISTWKAWVTNRPMEENRVASVSGRGRPSSGKGTDRREAMFMFGGLGWTNDTVMQP